MADTRELLGRLQTLVSEELKSISYKWLAREVGVPANRAKQILFSFADTHRKQVHVTYLLAGWTKEAAQQHVVRLVDADHLHEAKAQLSTVTSLHVHSVQPSQPKDPADLWNTDSEQTAALFERMVQQLETNCLAANSLSAVSCPAAQRDSEAAKRRRPGAAPAAPSQPAKPQASKGAAAKIDAIMKEPVGRSGSASASAAQRSSDAAGKVKAAGAASAPSATGKGQAASKASLKGKGSSLFGNATAKASAKQAPKSSTAAASITTAADESKMASESEDEEAVLPSKRKAGRRAVLEDDSDGEAEPAAAAAPTSEASQPRKPAAKLQATGKKAKAEAAAAEASSEAAAAAGEAATAAGKQKGAGNKAAKRSSSQPALGKAKAGAVAGVKRRKVSRTTINEKGEEVTETVWEDEDGDSQEEAPAGVAATDKTQPAEKARNAAPAPKSAPVRPSPQKPSAKGGKGKGKGGGAGQKSLTSFFSKK